MSAMALPAWKRHYSRHPVYFKQGDNLVAQVENGLVKVKDIGTGFMLIKTNVFKKIIESPVMISIKVNGSMLAFILLNLAAGLCFINNFSAMKR